MRRFGNVGVGVALGALMLVGTAQAAGAASAAGDPPSVSVAVAGVGLPSRISIESDVVGVTSFDYAVVGGQPRPRPSVVAARNGVGAGTIVFPAAGQVDVTAHAYVGKRLVGESTQSVDVSDVPGVTSAQFLNPDVTPLAGTTGSFAFTPHARGVVKYYWWINDGAAQTVRAKTDGTAKVSWTPPADVSAKYELFVESVTAEGVVSQQYDEWVRVQDSRPDIEVAGGTHQVGQPVSVTIGNDATEVTGLVYSFDGGPQQAVSGRSATVQVTPKRVGASTFTAQTVLAGGAKSKAATATVTVTDMPQVTVSAPHGLTQPVGGEPATFSFTPAVPNVVSYQYAVDGDSRTVAAAADGTASVTLVTDSGGPHDLTVSSVDADGVVSDVRDYEFSSLDPTVWVYSDFSQGTGQQGFFSVVDNLTPVIASYHWSVDGGPEQVSPAGPADGTFTEVDYTPAHSGPGTVQVQAEYTDGTMSPSFTYTFDVD